MDRGDWLAVILLFLIPIPFISTNCLTSFSAKFMNETSEKRIQSFSIALSTFRMKQLESAGLTIILFGASLLIAYFYSGIHISHISWMTIVSTMILTHSVFGQLGWEIQTVSGDTVVEMINKWWFRILYSIGVILLFLTIVR